MSSQLSLWGVLFLGVKCFMPANGETVTIPISHPIPIDVSLSLLKNDSSFQGQFSVVIISRVSLSQCKTYCVSILIL